MTVRNIINIYIRAGNAEAGPPLGTVLGNLGINSLKFCQEFNEFTKELPFYPVPKVKLIVYTNKSFTFSTKLPRTGSILNLLRKDENFFGNKFYEYQSYIYTNDLIELAKFKFPTMDMNESIKIILGTIKSSNIFIMNEEDSDKD